MCGPPSPAPESRSTTIPVLGNRSEITVSTKVGETVAIEREVAEKGVDDGQSGLVNVLSRSAMSSHPFQQLICQVRLDFYTSYK